MGTMKFELYCIGMVAPGILPHATLVHPCTSQVEVGGARRDRTADLLHAMQALSQLSYGPKPTITSHFTM